MPEKAHAHRGWPPMVIYNAQYKIISERKSTCDMQTQKKHTKTKHKIQSVGNKNTTHCKHHVPNLQSQKSDKVHNQPIIFIVNNIVLV